MFGKFQRVPMVVLAIAFLAGCRTDPATSLVGKRFPNFVFPSPGSSDSVRSTDLIGTPALVVFWATWCGPCQEEVEELRQVLAQDGSRGLRIVGLSIDDTPAPVPLVVSKLSIPYPVATGALPFFDSLKLESIPQSFLLDRHGVVVESFTGAVAAKTFSDAIAKLSSD